MFYEVWTLKTKSRSKAKTLTGETFCGVCLYIFLLLLIYFYCIWCMDKYTG